MSRRIGIVIFGTILATLLVTGTGTLLLARVANRAQVIDRLEVQARRTNELLRGLAVIGGPNRGERAREVRQRVLRALNLTGIGEVVFTANGTRTGTLPAGVSWGQLDAEAPREGDVLSGGTGPVLWAAAGRTERAGARELVIVTVLTERQERFFGPTFRWFALGSAVAGLLGALVAVTAGRRLGQPLLAAARTTSHIAAGDLEARLPAPPPEDTDELAVLARSVNAMGDALQRAKEQERSFLLSVSHDLRTPMTSIRGYAEAIADGTAGDPARAATVILAESRRLERLVGDLLDLARIDADRFTMHPSEADVGEVCAGAADGFAPEIEEAGLRLQTDLAPGLVACVDVDRLAQVIANLLTNAVSYARSTVWLTARRVGGEAVVEVRDDGPGIPPEELAHVFDRLYQADNQRQRRHHGSGLGLAIVQELVQRIGGRVEARSAPGSGTTFAFRLPLS